MPLPQTVADHNRARTSCGIFVSREGSSQNRLRAEQLEVASRNLDCINQFRLVTAFHIKACAV